MQLLTFWLGRICNVGCNKTIKSQQAEKFFGNPTLWAEEVLFFSTGQSSAISWGKTLKKGKHLWGDQFRSGLVGQSGWGQEVGMAPLQLFINTKTLELPQLPENDKEDGYEDFEPEDKQEQQMRKRTKAMTMIIMIQTKTPMEWMRNSPSSPSSSLWCSVCSQV